MYTESISATVTSNSVIYTDSLQIPFSSKQGQWIEISSLHPGIQWCHPSV